MRLSFSDDTVKEVTGDPAVSVPDDQISATDFIVAMAKRLGFGINVE